jgi:hypothetical protein
MVKGNSTFVLSIRLPDDVLPILKERAKDKTVSAYVKQKILDSCYVNKSVNIVKPSEEPSQYVNTIIPKYDKRIHKAGDKVLMWDGKKWVEAIVPEMDADGYIVNKD